MEALRRLLALAVLSAVPVWLWSVWRKWKQDQIDHYFLVSPVPKPSWQIVGKKLIPELNDIPTLVAEMRESFNAGRSRPIAKRLEQLHALKRLLEENEKLIVETLQADLGRPEFEALYYDIYLPISEIDSMIKNLREYLRPEAKGFNLLTFPSINEVYKEPVGLVLVIGTWNYPIMLSLVPVLGAIAAGNCVVLKPCNVASKSAHLLADLVPKYLDPSIVSVVGTAMRGDRDTTAALLRHKWDHIFFTGSPSVGRVIMEGAARFLTPVTLELGGKNPVFVDKNANLDLAAKRTVWGRMMNCGQQCISPDYVLCHKDSLDEFLAHCKKWVPQLYGTDTKDNGNLGRVVGDKQTERLINLLNTHGGEVVCGGKYEAAARYIEPTVLKVTLDSPTMEEETFGPILLVVKVESMEEAIAYVNTRPKPLSLYIFSNDHDVQERIVHNTSSGGVTINGTLFHVAHPDLPFGGIGDSGTGAYHGKATFDTFVHKKPVLRKLILPDFGLLSDPFFVYPPWTPVKKKILRLLKPLI